jgi:predicted lipoprotein
VKVAVAIVFIAAALAILRPWTVVSNRTASARTFEPASYVASIWDSRVIPTAERSAIDLEAFMQGGASTGTTRAVFVKGTARVVDVDRASRVGLARLKLPWQKNGRGAAIQIGPVIRGTTVRDALDFIRFTDFLNQLEFAGVAGALNDRVLKTVLHSPLNAGSEVTFLGAVPNSTTAETVEIAPVELTVAGAAR